MNFLLFIWMFSTCLQVDVVINGNIHYSIFNKVVWNAWFESSNSGTGHILPSHSTDLSLSFSGEMTVRNDK